MWYLLKSLLENSVNNVDPVLFNNDRPKSPLFRKLEVYLFTRLNKILKSYTYSTCHHYNKNLNLKEYSHRLYIIAHIDCIFYNNIILD